MADPQTTPGEPILEFTTACTGVSVGAAPLSNNGLYFPKVNPMQFDEGADKSQAQVYDPALTPPTRRNPFCAPEVGLALFPFSQGTSPVAANTLELGDNPASFSKADARYSEGRSRTDQACDQCRVGKKRCGGRQPACETCVAQHIACSYHELPKKRGTANGYHAGMRRLLGLAIQNGLGGQLKQVWDDANASLEKRRVFVGKWKMESKDNAFEEAWRASEMHETLQEFLSEGEISSPLSLSAPVADKI